VASQVPGAEPQKRPINLAWLQRLKKSKHSHYNKAATKKIKLCVCILIAIKNKPSAQSQVKYF